MAKQTRVRRSISAADLERVRGGGGSAFTITANTASAPAAAGPSSLPIESMSFSYSRIQL